MSTASQILTGTVRVMQAVKYTAQLYTQWVVESLLLCVKYTVRGTLKFQHSDSVTHAHFAIPVTLCNHPPKKSHQVTTPIDHPVCVAYCLPLPCCSPFYFCALLLPSYSISISFHILFPILSIFYILPLSLFCDLLLVAMHSVPYVVPPCLGIPQSFLFGSPLQESECCVWL